MDIFKDTDHFLSGSFIITNIHDIRNMMMIWLSKAWKLCLQVQWTEPTNNMTILSNIPISDHLIRVQTTVISDRQERTRGIQTVNSSYTWLKSCFQWSVDLCRTMVTKKDMTLLWWLVVVIIIIKFKSLKYLLVPNCFRLDEFVLFCTLCIANNQAISDENSSCLIIHLFLNTEDDSRALILL